MELPFLTVIVVSSSPGTTTTVLPVSPIILAFVGSASHLPSTTNLYSCAPGFNSIVQVNTPDEFFVILLAVVLQPFMLPAR